MVVVSLSICVDCLQSAGSAGLVQSCRSHTHYSHTYPPKVANRLQHEVLLPENAAMSNVCQVDFEYVCVTRRRQSKPSNTQESKQRTTNWQQRTTARSSANLMKPNRTPTQYTHPRKRHNHPTHTHTPSRITDKLASKPRRGSPL